MSLYTFWILVGLVWVGMALAVGLTVGKGITNADEQAGINDDDDD